MPQEPLFARGQLALDPLQVDKAEVGQQEFRRLLPEAVGAEEHLVAAGAVAEERLVLVGPRQEQDPLLLDDGEREEAEAQGGIAVDQLLVQRVLGPEEVFRGHALAGQHGAADLLVEELEEVLDPELIIDEEVLFLLLRAPATRPCFR